MKLEILCTVDTCRVMLRKEMEIISFVLFLEYTMGLDEIVCGVRYLMLRLLA